MTPDNLNNFMSTTLISILAFAVIVFIAKDWKQGAWAKIGTTVFIALIIRDFAVNQGATTFGVMKWIASLVGINFS